MSFGVFRVLTVCVPKWHILEHLSLLPTSTWFSMASPIMSLISPQHTPLYSSSSHSFPKPRHGPPWCFVLTCCHSAWRPLLSDALRGPTSACLSPSTHLCLQLSHHPAVKLSCQPLSPHFASSTVTLCRGLSFTFLLSPGPHWHLSSLRAGISV